MEFFEQMMDLSLVHYTPHIPAYLELWFFLFLVTHATFNNYLSKFSPPFQIREEHNIRQEEIQPGGMKVWTDPFDRPGKPGNK